MLTACILSSLLAMAISIAAIVTRHSALGLAWGGVLAIVSLVTGTFQTERFRAWRVARARRRALDFVRKHAGR
jgi:hypothetical protein